MNACSMDDFSFGSLGLGGGPSPPLLTACVGASPSPQLVHRGEDTVIYRTYDTGYKVIVSDRPTRGQVLQLVHERNISQFLPHHCRKRVVTDVTTLHGRTAIVFRWASGTTLREWLRTPEAGSPAEWNVRLRAATNIARTLSDFHEAGVVYNCLSAEDVVLSPLGGEYVATLIDLSSALVYRDDDRREMDPSFERQVKENDLRGLGAVLDELFGGDARCASSGELAAGSAGTISNDAEGCPGGERGDRRRKRGKRQNQREELPPYLSSLISALLDVPSSPGRCYESARDAYHDLKILAESNYDSCYRKNRPDDFHGKGRLKFHGDAFYGRTVQMSMLSHLFQSSVALGDRPLMATISGYPGTGKSTLVNQMKKPLLDLNGCFVEGKFDKSARPDTVLTSALNSFFGRILAADAGATCTSMKWRIQDAIGSAKDNAMFEMLPNLQKWIVADGAAADVVAPTPKAKCIGSSQRLKFMVCKLIGAIACRDRPLVLFLDDLQWADETTLDIIRMLMTDPDIGHFLFLGCYRDNEVNVSHPLTAKLNAIKDHGVRIVSIKIGPIERECVNTLLSEVLSLPPILCRPLSTVVHNKTSGIILFILRFLASLNDEGLLWFCMTANRWMYNLEAIELKEIHGDVVSHMTEHMKNLSRKLQMGLKISACLGPKFDTQVLEKARRDAEFEETFLDSCVEFGFLQQRGPSQYVWSHDQIQQAAYDLIPLPKRESFHLLLGTRLFMTTRPSDMHSMIFFIVDNMNRGSKLLDDPDQKYDVARLNLLAGERALSASAFHSAVEYLTTGLSLLGSKCWEEKYDLTIRLYDAASEALFVVGDFTRLSVLVDESLIKARSFNDRLNQLNNLVRSLAASSKFKEGISKCLDVLCQLGEEIPTEATNDIIQVRVAEVNRLLHGKSQSDLLSLPNMSDDKKLAAMQFMNHILSMGHFANPKLNRIIILQMVKMSIEHGICNISAFAFACYGTHLINEPFSDIEAGHRMGRVATEMTEKLGAVEMIPRLYINVYGLINIWKEPWQAAFTKHLEAYESGSTTGDIEYAVINLYFYVNIATFGGCVEDLKSFSETIHSYITRAFQCNQSHMTKCLVILHQLILDLMGVKQNAFSFFSDTMTEDSCFTMTRNNNEKPICRLMCLKKKYVAFFTGDMKMAAEMYELCRQFPMESRGRLVSAISSVFIDGLIGFSFARKCGKDEKKWVNIGLDAIKWFKKWVKNSEWNFSNKLHLLEAEGYFLIGDGAKAIDSYNASIKAAREHRFVNEEGLAQEKLAAFFFHQSNNEKAMDHLINAKKCYEAWGATGLADRVDKAIKLVECNCIDDKLA